jgi:hypothetical protein
LLRFHRCASGSCKAKGCCSQRAREPPVVCGVGGTLRWQAVAVGISGARRGARIGAVRVRRARMRRVDADRECRGETAAARQGAALAHRLARPFAAESDEDGQLGGYRDIAVAAPRLRGGASCARAPSGRVARGRCR